MAGGVVQVIINAKDNASKVIAGIARNTDKIGKGARVAGRGLGFLGGAAGLAFGAAGLATAGILGLGSKIAADSTAALTLAAGAANNWSSLTGESFDLAKERVEDMTKVLTEQAARLPGTTQGYTNLSNAVLDNVVTAFTAANGVIDKDASMGWIESNIANLEILRQASGATSQQTAKDVSKFLGGQYRSEKQMRRTLFFAQNPTMMTNLEKVAEKMGYDTIDAMLKGASQKQLAEALGEASQMSVTEDLKKELGETFEGAVEGIKTKLFDPNVGLFGGLRKFTLNGVETDLNRAVGSRIDRVSNSLSDMFGHLQKAAGYLGINLDPLLGITSAFEVLARISEGISSAVRGISIPRLINIFKPLTDAFKGMQGATNIDGFLANFRSFMDNLGNLGGRLVNAATQFIDGVDLGEVFDSSVSIGASISSGIASFFDSVDWGSVIKLTGAVVISLAGLVGGATLQGATDLGQAAIDYDLELQKATNDMARIYGERFRGWIGEETQKFNTQSIQPTMSAAGATLGGTWTNITSGLSNAWTSMTSSMSAAASAAGASLRAIGSQLGSAIRTGITWIGNAISQGWQAAIAMGQAAVGVLAGIGGAIAATISNGLQAIGDSIKGAIDSMLASARSAASNIPIIGGLFGGSGASPSGLGAASRANGQGVGSFQRALSRERRLMPHGSEPVIANSSELIIPRSELGAATQYLAGRNASPTATVQHRAGDNIVINVHGAGQNPEAIAMAVQTRLRQQQERSKRTALA